MSLTPERVEKIISGVLQEIPDDDLSLSDMRNLVAELLFGLGLNPRDMPLFLIILVDAYMGERIVDQIKKG
jgi:hypothetical protein|tara:strand:+ start:341 stop:553 length:213 start_codon:yes stop_codon:yes gene_type:complete